MNYAPICLFVYKRPLHTQKTWQSLSMNPEASESVLHVFADGARSAEDEIGVQSVRAEIRKITGFKEIIFHESSSNKGLANSIIAGVSKIVKQHQQVIVLEDDMICSRYFLKYMNEALEKYRHNTQVASIHGYLLPLKTTPPETFFIRGADCWGWATWERAWSAFEADGKKLLKELREQKLETEFNFGDTYPYIEMLERQIRGQVNSWAIRWLASTYLKGWLTLYPGRSMIQNIGMDGSGEHCDEDPNHAVVLSTSPIELKDISLQENVEMRSAFATFFKSLQPPIWKQKLNALKFKIKVLFPFLKKWRG